MCYGSMVRGMKEGKKGGSKKVSGKVCMGGCGVNKMVRGVSTPVPYPRYPCGTLPSPDGRALMDTSSSRQVKLRNHVLAEPP